MRFGVIADPDSVRVRAYVDSLACACGDLGRVSTGVDALEADALVVLDGVPADSPVSTVLARRVRDGVPVLGVGQGFGALCELGFLDGRVEGAEGLSERVHCIVEGRPTPFTAAIPAGRHVATTRGWPGRYVAADVDRLEAEARVVMRFCSPDGEALPEDAIAGVCDDGGRVVGILPVCDGSLFRAALAWKRGTPARVQ